MDFLHEVLSETQFPANSILENSGGHKKSRGSLLPRLTKTIGVCGAPLKLRGLEELGAGALPQSFYFAQFCAQPRRSLFCLLLCLNHNLLGDDPDLLYRSNLLCLLHPLTSSFSTFPKAVRFVPGDPLSVNRY